MPWQSSRPNQRQPAKQASAECAELRMMLLCLGRKPTNGELGCGESSWGSPRCSAYPRPLPGGVEEHLQAVSAPGRHPLISRCSSVQAATANERCSRIAAGGACLCDVSPTPRWGTSTSSTPAGVLPESLRYGVAVNLLSAILLAIFPSWPLYLVQWAEYTIFVQCSE